VKEVREGREKREKGEGDFEETKEALKEEEEEEGKGKPGEEEEEEEEGGAFLLLQKKAYVLEWASIFILDFPFLFITSLIDMENFDDKEEDRDEDSIEAREGDRFPRPCRIKVMENFLAILRSVPTSFFL